MRLDNAALIFPAARRRYWTNVFRISVSFRDEVDPALLQKALDRTVPRFPSIAVRLRTGVFWYYFETLPAPPGILKEEQYPLNRIPFRTIRKQAFRVLYYRCRMSVEFFHSVTDGSGAMIFAKTLAAEYVRLRYGVDVPCTDGILDLAVPPCEAELEDSFSRYASPVSASRKEDNAYRMAGTREPDGFLHVTTGFLDAGEVKRKAKSLDVSVTMYLAAVMMKALYDVQNERVRRPGKRKPVRVLIPVNLRRLFPSRTMRNFTSYITPAVDPAMGAFTFEEMLSTVCHRIGLELTPKHLSAKFTPNVRSAQSKILRVMPLFIKNVAMKMVYNRVGERKSSICLSNLGVVTLPDVMRPYVTRIDFVLGPQAETPCNCGVSTYDGRLIVNFTRNIEEADLERHFFTELRRQGLVARIESNQTGSGSSAPDGADGSVRPIPDPPGKEK